MNNEGGPSMKKILYAFVVITLLLLVIALPGYAHGRVRGGIWIGPVWGPWWWGPPAYTYYSPPVVQQAPAYEQQPPQVEEQQYYWYYCADAKAYYPYVKECPGGWMKVVPPSGPPKGK